MDYIEKILAYGMLFEILFIVSFGLITGVWPDFSGCH